jgi:hypothetical protein
MLLNRIKLLQGVSLHTQYNVLSLLSFFSSHMVNLAIGVVLLPLRSRLASCSSSRQLVGALSGEMTTHATLETRPQTLTSWVLRILRSLRCGVGYRFWFLSWLQLYILVVHLL